MSAIGVSEAGSNSIPWLLRCCLLAMIGSGSVVFLEPAPCDLLFLVLLGLVVTGPWVRLPGRSEALHVIGAWLFLLGNVVSCMWMEQTSLTVRFFAITVYLFLLWFVLLGLVARAGRPLICSLFDAFVVAAVVSAVVGLLARFELIPNAQMFFRDEHAQRIKSTFKDPNVFAPFLVCGAMIVVWNILEKRHKFGVNLVALVLCLLGILFAFSRGAYFNLGVTLIVFLGCHFCLIRDPRTMTSITRLLVSSLVICVLAIPWLLSQASQGDYFSQRLSFQGYDSERFGAQARALELAMEHKLGIGPGQWLIDRFGLATHSTYARVAVENGLLGFFGLMVFFGACVMTALRLTVRRGRDAGLAAMCLACQVGMLAESVVIDTLHWRHLFVFLAIPVGLSMVRSQDTPA